MQRCFFCAEKIEKQLIFLVPRRLPYGRCLWQAAAAAAGVYARVSSSLPWIMDVMDGKVKKVHAQGKEDQQLESMSFFDHQVFFLFCVCIFLCFFPQVMFYAGLVVG